MLMRALLVHIAHEIAGAARIRHSLRPLNWRGRKNYLQTSGALCRENAKLYQPSLRGALATKQSISPHAAPWIASRSLSSGAHSRDPVARNDVEKPRRTGSSACAEDDNR